MKYLIIGASSGLGRELANKFAEKKKNLILVSRDERDLKALKTDLELKHSVSVEYLALDFSSIEDIEKNLISNKDITNEIDGILFPVGLIFDEDNYQIDHSKIKQLIYTNYISISYTIYKLKENLNNENSFIIGFGSVSGLVGRNLNTNYAAAKRGLESFFESLFFDDDFKKINIQFYVLGYLDTNLAFGKNLNLPKGNVKKLATKVFNNRNKKSYKTYFPIYWNLIGIILKIVPLNLIIIFKNLLK